MTPERIAELRATAEAGDAAGHGFSGPWHEMLDEIERLQGLLTGLHRRPRKVWPASSERPE